MQSYGLPNFATVGQIGQMLQRGEIQKWHVDPKQNPNYAPNFFLLLVKSLDHTVCLHDMMHKRIKYFHQ
jgi:hypothetical protein